MIRATVLQHGGLLNLNLSYGVIGNTSGFGPEESRFEPLWDNTVYLIPGSRVKTIGEFGMSREWWCKLRGTYNGGVPKTKETMRMGDHALVRISTTQPGFDVRGNVLVCKGFESLPGYAKNTERSFLALGWVLQVQIFISIVPITLLDCGDHDRAYQDRSFTPPMLTIGTL